MAAIGAVSIKKMISRTRIAEIEVISTAGEAVEIGTVEVVGIVEIVVTVAIVEDVILIEMDVEEGISETMKEEKDPNVRAGGEVTIGALIAAVGSAVAAIAVVTIGHCRKGCGSWLEWTLAREAEMATMGRSLAVEEASEAAAT